jgi:hypothetical protein
VGAHALAFYAKPRFTEDLDLFVRRSHENAARVRSALEEFGFHLQDEAEAHLHQGHRAMIVLGRKPNQVDILNFLSGVDFDSAWNRRTSGLLGDIVVNYISLEDLAATKRAAARPQDLADLAQLEPLLETSTKQDEA